MKTGYENTNFGQRLISLYNDKNIDCNKRGWSQKVARKMLDNGYGDLSWHWPEEMKPERTEQANKVAHTLREHLKYKRAEEVSMKWLCIYRSFFGCSAGYLYGEFDSFLPEYKEVRAVTGLSDRAIRQLDRLNKNRARMPLADEMHATLERILSNPDRMADLLQAVGNIVGTVHYRDSAADLPTLPDMDTADPAFVRVVQKERLYMAAENLQKK